MGFILRFVAPFSFSLLITGFFLLAQELNENDLNASVHSCQQFDWVEYESSVGSGTKHIRDLLGNSVRIVGLYKDEKKISKCKSMNETCIFGDLVKLNLPDGCFTGVSFINSLDHLSSKEEGKNAITSAVNAAQDVVYYRGPLLHTSVLGKHNLGFYHQNWKGRSSHIDLNDIIEGLKKSSKHEKANLLAYYGKVRVANSGHQAIIPINDLSVNAHEYSPSFGEKPDPLIKFHPPLPVELIVLITFPKDSLDEQAIITDDFYKYLEHSVSYRTAAIASYTAPTGLIKYNNFVESCLENAKS